MYYKMAVAAEETLFLEARAVYGREFDTWTAGLLQVLQSKDRTNNCLSFLRQLLVLTSVTKYNRNLSSQVYRSLRSMTLEPEQGPVKMRLLSAAILRELSPLQKTLIRDFTPPTDSQNIPYILPVLLSQSNIRDQSVILISHIVRWLTLPGIEEELCLSALSCLHTILSHSSVFEKFTEDQIELIRTKICHWLRHASKNSLSLPSSGISLFSSGSKKQVVPVKEIDGSTSQDIFTILSIGDFYSCDQLLNIRVFSMLRRWIIMSQTAGGGGHSPSPGNTPTPDGSFQERNSPVYNSLTSSMIVGGMTTPPSYNPSPSLSLSYRSEVPEITNVTLQYCLRVINQCERKPLKTSDDELIKACLYEAVTLLDMLCSLRKRIIHEVFSTVKTLFVRISQDDSYTRVLLALVKFFINHGESEYSYEPSVQTFFGDILNNKFNDPGISYDTIDFCVSHLEQLCHSTQIFTKYFPNLLKILAWSPPTYIAEFLELLPAFISETTASEVLHSLFDLPCLSVVLTANHLLYNVPMAIEQNVLPRYSKCLLALQDPGHKLMFGHFLRTESGRGDTIDRLTYMHELLEDFNTHQRVVNSGEIVPLLLKVYFKVVVHFGSKSLLSELINVLFERTLCLYNEPYYQEEVRKVIAESLVDIFKAHPSLLVDKSKDIIEILMNLRVIRAGGGEVYLHLVWAVGEFAHTGYDSRCSAALLSQFYETLETTGYEIAMNIGTYVSFTVRLMVTLMSTLAKLASRCQDLIPRALLSLNKIVSQSIQNTPTVANRKLMIVRMNELTNILKMPSVASAVLTPPPNCCDPEEVSRQMNIATIMQSTTFLISRTTDGTVSE